MLNLMTSSKISVSPSCVIAEHSKYLKAPISWAIASPSSYGIGHIPALRSSFRFSGSSRRSNLVPTKIYGTSGHSFWISGSHLVLMFLKETRFAREKESRNISWEGWTITVESNVELNSFRRIQLTAFLYTSLRTFKNLSWPPVSHRLKWIGWVLTSWVEE